MWRSRRLRVVAALVAALVVAGVASEGCALRRLVAGRRCPKVGELAHDGRFVLRCSARGRWQRGVSLAVAAVALGALRARAAAEGGWWRPTPDRPLNLHWVLGDPLDVADPVQMGLRDLAGNPLPPPDVYDIDGQMNSASTVAELHRRGAKVICYVDVGAYEDYRPDASRFPPEVIGKPDQGWEGSRWLDIRRIDVLEPIMRDRIADCRAKGFDAVEPDETDGFENDTGFPLTRQDQVAYARSVARWIHEAGLSAGQKGTIALTSELVDAFDWTLNEECFQYGECDTGGGGLQQYTDAGKAVWIAEYRTGVPDCGVAASRRWNAARYVLGLPNDGGRQPCGGW